MAQTKKNRAEKSRGRAKRKPQQTQVNKASKLGWEIKGVLLAAALVYILLSLYGLNTGKVGLWVAGGVTYLLGSGSKVITALGFFDSYTLFTGRKLQITPKRLGVFLLSLVFLTYSHLSLLVLEPLETIPATFAEISGPVGTAQGGGVVGAVLLFVSLRFFDVIGTYVVIGAVSLIGIIMVLDKTMRQFIGRVVQFIFRTLRSLLFGIGYLIGLCFRGIRNSILGTSPVLTKSEVDTSANEAIKSLPALKPNQFKPGKAEPRLTGRNIPPEVAATGEVPIAINTYQESESESKAEKFNPENVRRSKDGAYLLPPLDLLLPPAKTGGQAARTELVQLGRLLEETLANFGIEAKVVQIDCGPVITRYEIQPAPGIKVSRIVGLADDIALALAAEDIRIEAPIPGKAAVGIEVPNKKQETVRISEVIATAEYHQAKYKLPLVLGKGVAGDLQIVDLCSMPHLLIAGATGSGKSVCINNFIISLLYRLRPDQLRILLIDPKRVELAVYDGIPHLLAPVITDPKKAAAALKWVVEEMENRYELFANAGVRSMDKYNAWVVEQQKRQGKAAQQSEQGDQAENEAVEPLPYMVVIIDELADLMMVATSDVEDSICRIAQMARAAGIHLVVATQRPSVDVITGLIKANIPARIAFAVSSQVDSRTILDSSGAERLIGRGDMLYQSPSSAKTIRIQGAYITDKEIEAVVEFLKSQGAPEYETVIGERALKVDTTEEVDDELFDDAVRLVINSGQASISLLQRRFRIGHSRAARLMDMMELKGIVGPYQGSKPREVLVRSNAEDEY